MRRVIGIGSPHGDDAAGLLVARHLDATDCPGVQVVECGRPVPDLLDALEGAEAAVLVDAVRAGGDAGALRRLDPGQLARAEASSSHGLGVAHALALHRALGRHEVPLACLGIEAGAARRGDPCAAVRAAVPRAAARALALLHELRAGTED